MVESPRPNSVQRGLQRRDNDAQRLEEVQAGLIRLSGRFQMIGGTGGGNYESTIHVSFPMTFAERPAFSFGWELAEQQRDTLQVGYMPHVSVGVASWDKTEKLEGVFHYTGATLIVSARNMTPYLWIHWHMEGHAFQNPVA